MSEVAIFATLGYVLNLFSDVYSKTFLPNGGAIGIAMICILIIAYRRGGTAALMVGLIMAIFDIVDGCYAIAADWWKAMLQVVLDYGVAFPLVAMAGLFKKKFDNALTIGQKSKYIIYGSLLGGFCRLVAHYLSGILFWSDGMLWDVGGPYIYSLLYNAAYIVPSIILCISLMLLMLHKWPQILIPEDMQYESRNNVKEQSNEK